MSNSDSSRNTKHSSERHQRFVTPRPRGFLTPNFGESDNQNGRALLRGLRSFSSNNSPVTNHKSSEQRLSFGEKDLRWSERRRESSSENGNTLTYTLQSRDTGFSPVSQLDEHYGQSSPHGSDVAKTTTNFLHSKVFNKLKQRARRTTHSASTSTEGSPVCGEKLLKRCDSLSPEHVTSQETRVSTGVRLIDTRIIKGQNGFGITLTEVLTFISSRLLGLQVPATLHPDKVGFYQRLLQVRHVAENWNTYKSQLDQSTHVRPGDILLAIGRNRLAGCSPDYAVRLLSGVPVGSAVSVTLLRGISLAPINLKPCHSQPPSPLTDTCTHSSIKYVRTSSLNRKDYGIPNLKTFNLNTSKIQASQSVITSSSPNTKEYHTTPGRVEQLQDFVFEEPVGTLINSKINPCIDPGASHDTHSQMQPRPTRTWSNTTYELIQRNPVEGITVNASDAVPLCSVLNGTAGSPVTTQPNLLIPVTQYNFMPLLVCTKSGSSDRSELPCSNNANGVQSGLLENVPISIPEKFGIQGVGRSGPCKTPDYVPASCFLRKQDHHSPSSIVSVHSIISHMHHDTGWKGEDSGGNEKCSPSTKSVPPSCTHTFPSSSSASSDHEVRLVVINSHCGIQIGQSSAMKNMVYVQSVNPQHVLNPEVAPRPGDVLVAIEGCSVFNRSELEVRELLQHYSKTCQSNQIRLSIRRNSIRSPSSCQVPSKIKFRSFESSPTTQEKITDQENPDTFDVTLERHENEGFGFVLVSSLNSNKPSEIGRIITGSPADRCGKLKVGYRILAINGERLAGMHHMEIVKLIRQNQQKLILTIQRPKSPHIYNSIGVNNDLDEISNLLRGINGLNASMDDKTNSIETAYEKTDKLVDTEQKEINLQPLIDGISSLYRVNLTKGSEGFGFSIRGGTGFERIPLFVFRITEGGPTNLDGRIQVGDEIVEINGVPAHTMTHQEAVNAIQQSGQQLELLLSRHSSSLNEATV